MRKPVALIIIGLTLLAAASRDDQTLLVYTIGFLVALALYLIAVAILFATAASPFLLAAAIWLDKRRRQGKPLPRSIRALHRRASRRFRLLNRITAVGRAAKQAWRQNASSQPTAPGDRPTHADAADASPSTA